MSIADRDPPRRRTPFAFLDRERLTRNLIRMQALADRHGVALRPHIKTHKSVEIARQQLALGAVGVTASKPSEALPFIRSGVRSLLLAYPIVAHERVMELLDAASEHGTTVTFILDSEIGAEALAEAARRAGRVLNVHVKVDVGLGRIGVRPASSALVSLAGKVASNPMLSLTGLISHAGHGYGAANSEALAYIARDERLSIIESRECLKPLGLPLRLSVGSTPTVLSTADFDGIDEIRPGNYALFDLTAERLGVATEDDIALCVVATVVSRNDRNYIIDAGSKALTSDLGPHSSGGLTGFGRVLLADGEDRDIRLSVSRLSEEHGFIPREGTDLPIGTRIIVLPNHSCPVVNLYGRLIVGEEPSNDVVVSARGAVT